MKIREEKIMIKKMLIILISIVLIVTAMPIPGMNIFTQDDFFQINNEDNQFFTSYIPGTWLLSTQWGQHDPYDGKTPTNSTGDHYRLGCWSVAIGQIMRFHELQSHGLVEYLYQNEDGDYIPCVNDLDAFTYDFALMPDKLNESSSPEEIDHTSQLLYDTATVIQKNFGHNNYMLNSSEKVGKLIYHFQYISVQTEFVNNPPIADIIDEIDNYRPCMLYLENINGTIGHAVVIDGYQWQQDFEVHINMGWNGNNDSFYEYDEPINIFDNNAVRGVMFIRLSPSKPHKPTGPNNGVPGINYNFTTRTTAPKDPIYYRWDWGDGTFSDWMGRYNSNEVCEATHKWKEKGSYSIRVKAKDIDGWESPWSDPLTVKMPRDKTINNIFLGFLENFLQSHPNLFPIIRQLLGLQ